MSEFETVADIANRIDKIYIANSMMLSNTDVQTAVNTYLAVENPTINDLNTLRIAINTYKDDLGSSHTDLFAAANILLVSIEQEYYFEKMGYTPLSSSFTGESFDGGTTYVPTITSAIGPHDISPISATDDNTITGVLGHTALQDTILLGVTTPAAKSISGQLFAMNNAISAAIGTSSINIPAGIAINACTVSSLGTLIFQAPDPVALVDAFNGITACASWAAQAASYGYGVTNDGTFASCQIFDPAIAYSGCVWKLTGGDAPG